MKNISLTIRIDEKDYAFLQAESKAAGKTKGRLIREMIAAYKKKPDTHLSMRKIVRELGWLTARVEKLEAERKEML